MAGLSKLSIYCRISVDSWRSDLARSNQRWESENEWTFLLKEALIWVFSGLWVNDQGSDVNMKVWTSREDKVRKEPSINCSIHPYETFNKTKKPTVWIIEIGNLGVRIRSAMLQTAFKKFPSGRQVTNQHVHLRATTSVRHNRNRRRSRDCRRRRPTERQTESTSGGGNLVAKGSLINTLWVFLNPGIWDLKLVAWINIFPPLQAAVLYLTFWRFIYVNMPQIQRW